MAKTIVFTVAFLGWLTCVYLVFVLPTVQGGIALSGVIALTGVMWMCGPKKKKE